MLCDLCRNDDALEGLALCPICYEAILRLANAVKANAEAKPKRPDPLPTLRMPGPGYFKAAASAGNGGFRKHQAPSLSPPPLPSQSKPGVEDAWSEDLLPNFTD
jgi:hypothetical protein